MRYYIADLHFFHKGLIPYMDKRPFADVDEMNNYMVKQWNSRVKPQDEVIVLGDLSLGNGLQTNGILKKLNGRIYLIKGNHDHRYLKDKKFNKERFGWIKEYHELSDNNRKVVLSHYPVICYNGQYRKDKGGNPVSYMLYGHVHNTQDQKLVDSFMMQTRNTYAFAARKTEPEPIPCNMVNCFCMYSDYIPLTLDEWIQTNETRLTKYNE